MRPSSAAARASDRACAGARRAVAYENSLVWIRSTPGTGGSPTVSEEGVVQAAGLVAIVVSGAEIRKPCLNEALDDREDERGRHPEE